jgi:hypothetical protein
MTDARTRFEHQASKTADRDVSPDAILVDDNKSPVEHVDVALINKDYRGAVFQRDGPRWWQAGQCRAAHRGGRRSSISPRPKALPRPKPRATFAMKMFGSRTVSIPSNSTTPSLREDLPLPRMFNGS